MADQFEIDPTLAELTYSPERESLVVDGIFSGGTEPLGNGEYLRADEVTAGLRVVIRAAYRIKLERPDIGQRRLLAVVHKAMAERGMCFESMFTESTDRKRAVERAKVMLAGEIGRAHALLDAGDKVA